MICTPALAFWRARWNARGALLSAPRSCDSAFMTRPDLYDYIGMVLAAGVLALWVAHFVLPTPPPDPARLPQGAPGALPTLGPR
jgi:hypothetical protein